MDTGGGEEMDESLQLALQLQQEELQWHAAGVAAHAGTLDEDVRLAMQLSQQDEDEHGAELDDDDEM